MTKLRFTEPIGPDGLYTAVDFYQCTCEARRWRLSRAEGSPADDDVHARMSTALRELYGERARLVEVRPATEDEELQYLRGDEPRNVFCPTGQQDPPAHGR